MIKKTTLNTIISEIKKVEKTLRIELKKTERLLRREILKLEERAERVEEKVDRIDAVDGKLDKIQNTLDSFLGRVDSLEKDNIVRAHQVRELELRIDGHEKIIAGLQPPRQ